MAEQRIQWLDIARGIGIVLVVVGHAERGLMAGGIAQGEGWNLFDLGLYTFHMPLFMLLAGLNVPGSLKRGKGAFLKGKLWTIAYPYVLWSLIQGGLMIALAGVTNGQADGSTLAKIGWQPISPFWFLYALMIYMVVVALTGARAAVLLPLAAVGVVSSYWLDGESLALQVSFQAIFFVAGVLLAERIKTLSAPPIALPLVAGLWGLAFLLMPVAGDPPYLKPWILPAAAFGILFILLLSRLLANSLVQPLLVSLGRASMTIYVLHILGTAGTRIVLNKLNLTHDPFVYLMACVAVGVAGPWVAHQIFMRLNLLPWLGLAPLKRQ